MQACTKSWEHGLYIQLASPHNNVIACYGAARMHTLVSWHLVTTNICTQKLQDSLLYARSRPSLLVEETVHPATERYTKGLKKPCSKYYGAILFLRAPPYYDRTIASSRIPLMGPRRREVNKPSWQDPTLNIKALTWVAVKIYGPFFGYPK